MRTVGYWLAPCLNLSRANLPPPCESMMTSSGNFSSAFPLFGIYTSYVFFVSNLQLSVFSTICTDSFDLLVPLQETSPQKSMEYRTVYNLFIYFKCIVNNKSMYLL